MWTQLQLLKTAELMDSLSWYKNFRAASWFNLKMLPVDWPYLWPYHWLKSASSMPSPTIHRTWKVSRQSQPGFSFASYLCLLLCSDMLLSWSRNTGRYRWASFSFEKLISHCRTARTNFNFANHWTTTTATTSLVAIMKWCLHKLVEPFCHETNATPMPKCLT